jgi:hypothetical protein
MQTHLTQIIRRAAAISAFAAGALGAVGAQAGQGGVYWSVNIDAPSHGGGRVGTVVSNTPRGIHGPAPVIIAPPVVYAPQPVYHARPPAFHVDSRHGHAPHWRGGHGWWKHRHHHQGYHQGYRHGYHEGHRDARGDWGDRDDHRWHGGHR